eukprot:4767834-Prymnesium_polylepis.3
MLLIGRYGDWCLHSRTGEWRRVTGVARLCFSGYRQIARMKDVPLAHARHTFSGARRDSACALSMHSTFILVAQGGLGARSWPVVVTYTRLRT